MAPVQHEDKIGNNKKLSFSTYLSLSLIFSSPIIVIEIKYRAARVLNREILLTSQVSNSNPLTPPLKAVKLLMISKPQIRVTGAVKGGIRRVEAVIEDIDLGANGLGGDMKPRRRG